MLHRNNDAHIELAHELCHSNMPEVPPAPYLSAEVYEWLPVLSFYTARIPQFLVLRDPQDMHLFLTISRLGAHTVHMDERAWLLQAWSFHLFPGVPCSLRVIDPLRLAGMPHSSVICDSEQM